MSPKSPPVSNTLPLFSEWYASFISAAERLTSKIKAYIPTQGDRFHQANLPGFPQHRAEREILHELRNILNLIKSWNDAFENEKGCSSEVVMGITWFGNVGRRLLNRWGYISICNKQISCQGSSASKSPKKQKRRNIRKEELESLDKALAMMCSKSSPVQYSPPCFPNFDAPAQGVSIPNPPTAELSSKTPDPERAPSFKDDQLCPCQRDCLKIIGQAGRRLTTSQVMTRLKEAGMLHGESTIKMALAFLVRTNHLTNRQGVKPRGYGLPEWDSLPMTSATA
jgi:hypothetical protein